MVFLKTHSKQGTCRENLTPEWSIYEGPFLNVQRGSQVRKAAPSPPWAGDSGRPRPERPPSSSAGRGPSRFYTRLGAAAPLSALGVSMGVAQGLPWLWSAWASEDDPVPGPVGDLQPSPRFTSLRIVHVFK